MTTFFGLDVGTASIKVAQVSMVNKVPRLIAAGMAKTPPNVFSSEAEKDLLALAEAIKKLKTEARITTNEVAVALPEKSLFTRVVEFPKMSEDELTQAIPWEAENLIPKPLSEINLDWEIIEDEESQKLGKISVLLVAAPSDLVNKYLHILKLADLVPLVLESELISIVRCFKPIINKNSLLIINLGTKGCDIAVVRKGSLFTTRSLPTGGEAITRAISSSLGFDLPVGEEYKKAYGLSSQVEGKVAEVIEPVMSSILNEVKKAIRFYEEKEQNPLKLAILSGGTCLLPGISEYFAKNLNMEVQIADPFSLIGTDQQISPELKKNSPLFAIALGLALRER